MRVVVIEFRFAKHEDADDVINLLSNDVVEGTTATVVSDSVEVEQK